MLVLSRQENESIVIADRITVKVVSIPAIPDETCCGRGWAAKETGGDVGNGKIVKGVKSKAASLRRSWSTEASR